ncbi:MAG: DUF1343 domain-containing protein [Bacteroidota bacterium]
MNKWLWAKPVRNLDYNIRKSALLLSLFFTFFAAGLNACAQKKTDEQSAQSQGGVPAEITLGVERMSVYLPLLEGKKVACVLNNSSLINGKHLADTLKKLKVNIVKIFTPEHGIRGDADAGEKVNNAIDSKTGIPIVSLYGSHKQPTAEDMENVDIMLYDIQDVGVRFFTYHSTLHYVMQACAEESVPLVLLDRPNPNGDQIDGPVLDTAWSSFVGMHPVPILHGLTSGEMAKMINGEGWLQGKVKCGLEVINMYGYSHKSVYYPPVRPSPNLPNALSVRLYASLCLFEGTVISVGRGTDFPFQVAGGTDSAYGSFKFTPHSAFGAAKPMYEGKTCYGEDYRSQALSQTFTLKYLLDFYNRSPDKSKFFIKFFDRLAGGPALKQQIMLGKTEAQIRGSWDAELFRYKHMRRKYRIYLD